MDADRILEQVREEGLVAPGVPVVVLLSGGRDSVCMLDLAARVAGVEAVTALHVNYGLRDDSDADERHCAALAERLGVRLEIERPRRPEGPGNLQAWARDVRYAAAARLAGRRGRVLLHGGRDDDGCGRWSLVACEPEASLECRGRDLLRRDAAGRVTESPTATIDTSTTVPRSPDASVRPAMSGPRARVHIKAPRPSYLYRRAAGTTDFVTACQTPCDAEMPIGDTFKIGGRGFKTTSEFTLDAAPGADVELAVDGPLRYEQQRPGCEYVWRKRCRAGRVGA